MVINVHKNNMYIHNEQVHPEESTLKERLQLSILPVEKENSFLG